MKALAILVAGCAIISASPVLAHGAIAMRPSPGFHNGGSPHPGGGGGGHGGHDHDGGAEIGSGWLTYPVGYAAPDAAADSPPLLCPPPPLPSPAPARDNRPAGPHIIYIGSKPAAATGVKVIYGSD